MLLPFAVFLHLQFTGILVGKVFPAMKLALLLLRLAAIG